MVLSWQSLSVHGNRVINQLKIVENVSWGSLLGNQKQYEPDKHTQRNRSVVSGLATYTAMDSAGFTPIALQHQGGCMSG